MISFEGLTHLGVETAAMTERSDGSFGGMSSAEVGGALGADAQRLCRVRQVHGSTVVEVDGVQTGDSVEADGMVTCSTDVVLAISIADCVPLFLAEPEAGVLGLVHAGREGTRLNIAREAIRMMESLGAKPGLIRAVIGPSAGPCCYEVSEVMALDMAEQGLTVQGRCVDLWESNRLQLRSIGVLDAHISVQKLCTICSSGFYSFRRGDRIERNLGLLGWDWLRDSS